MPEDPEERITELENELAEAKYAAGQRSSIPANTVEADLAPPPRSIPAAFRFAELLPFRWWYIWTLFMVAVTPIALWIGMPVAFSVAAVLTLVGIYAFQLWKGRTRLELLKWGVPATVTNTELLSQGTYYSGTTYYNVFVPVAHGWTVTRERWSGPSSKTRVQYTLNDYKGELTVRGREYIDGVILADQRNPAKALCVTAFPYDLDRDASGNWAGKIRPRLKLGMAVWLVIMIGWLALAAFVAVESYTNASSPTVARGGTPGQNGAVTVRGNSRHRSVECDDGNVAVSGNSNVVTITGHCASLRVSGNGNDVTVDSVDTISASGVDNVVTYHGGSPITNDSGISDVIQRG
ncbi:MAG TPA: DUF3060 domain-containing protein [Mycobacterium sp.]|nr:DUF3060 domain-containing protein [Mycobacterium sp.]